MIFVNLFFIAVCVVISAVLFKKGSTKTAVVFCILCLVNTFAVSIAFIH